jgi:hypothetical protein
MTATLDKRWLAIWIGINLANLLLWGTLALT